jgi:hypothetical protein
VIRQTAITLAVLLVIAAGLWAFVARHQRREAEPMRAVLRADIDAGSCAGLRRAQVLGRRLVLTDENDSGARAAVALAGAMLAVECAEPLTEDASVGAARGAPDRPQLLADEQATADAVAARMLLRIAGGWSIETVREAETAVAAAPRTPQPLYALGRTRARAGDLMGASRALEAAMVVGPTFFPARVVWAEVRLDLGDADAAAEALRALPTPDLRTRLLADEVERARGARIGVDAAAAAALDRGCDESRVDSALEAAGCALRDATRARLGGDRVRAHARALVAAEHAPAEPRLLARLSQLLAELGAVDRAAVLLARAERLASPGTPALAWAALAVALGRGRALPRPAAPPPPAPEGPLLEARAALASGGIGALAAIQDQRRAGAVAATVAGAGARDRDPDPDPDPDRDQLARLAVAGPAPRDAPGDPLAAYVAGLRARFDGDLPRAAEQLSHALSGHGDACRAAGEYIAVLRALNRRPAPEAFAALRAENARCVNLPR